MWTAVITSWDFEVRPQRLKPALDKAADRSSEPLRHPNASTDLPSTIANRCKTLKQML
jgi:hypothetical protein